MPVLKTMSHVRTKDTIGDQAFDQRSLYKSYSKTIVYVNRTGRSITVIDRMGVRVQVKSEPLSVAFKPDFIIRTNFSISYEQVEDVKNFLLSERFDMSKNPMLVLFKEQFLKKYAEVMANICGSRSPYGISVIIESSVSGDELRQYGELYISNHDIVVTVEDTDSVLHPFSDSSLMYDRYREMIESDHTSFGIEVVDNEHQIGDRFLYVMKKVYRVRPLRDPTRASGVYLVISDPLAWDPLGKQTFMTFDEAKTKIGLHPTAEEAETGGNPELLSEKALVEAKAKSEAETAALKSQLNQAETNLRLEEKKTKALDEEYKREKLRLEREMVDIKAMYETRKMKLEDEFSERIANRNDSASAIKFFAATVTAGLAVALAMLKLQKSS
jgi:hypothetical protein